MYDPITDDAIPSKQHKPSSFWAQSIGNKHYTALKSDITTDVAIIGAGYAGLSTAYHLQTQHNVDCVVLEANQPGWGCSGRNGGFVLPGTGRLSVQQMAKRWDKATSQAIYQEYLDSIRLVSAFVEQGIECDMTQGGYLKLAHKPSLVEGLHQQAEILSNDYGDSILALSGEQIESTLLSGAKAYGGVYYPNAFGINPWKFAQGLAEKASLAGAAIYGDSPVVSTRFDGRYHYLETPKAMIKAKTLVLTTNAYGARQLFPVLRDRLFPVISSIILTEPLTTQQLAAIGMKDGLMVMDTRSLKYYYRLLPDNRLLFGGRGAIQGRHSASSKIKQSLIDGLSATFPQLSGTDVSHFWSGWVGVSLDDYPRIYHDKQQRTLYSAGYCGAGLAFSTMAGKRLAQLYVSPDELPQLPYWQTSLKPFPLPMLRRPALKGFYAWEALKRTLGI